MRRTVGHIPAAVINGQQAPQQIQSLRKQQLWKLHFGCAVPFCLQAWAVHVVFQLVIDSFLILWAHAVRAQGSDGHLYICGLVKKKPYWLKANAVQKTQVQSKQTDNQQKQKNPTTKPNKTSTTDAPRWQVKRWNAAPWPSALSHTSQRNRTTRSIFLPSCQRWHPIQMLASPCKRAGNTSVDQLQFGSQEDPFLAIKRSSRPAAWQGLHCCPSRRAKPEPRSSLASESIPMMLRQHTQNEWNSLFFELSCARHYNSGSHWAVLGLSLLDNGIKRKGQGRWKAKQTNPQTTTNRNHQSLTNRGKGETSSGSHGKLQSPALTTSSAGNSQRPMQCVVTL